MIGQRNDRGGNQKEWESKNKSLSSVKAVIQTSTNHIMASNRILKFNKLRLRKLPAELTGWNMDAFGK